MVLEGLVTLKGLMVLEGLVALGFRLFNFMTATVVHVGRIRSTCRTRKGRLMKGVVGCSE